MMFYVLIFSTHLMMAAKVQAQCESPAFGGNLIVIISDQQTFPEGSTVKLKCSTGYIPARSASRSIICSGNQWSKPQLQCKKKSCGNPGDILHGYYVIPEDILYGATIRAQCNEGYQLVGNSMRNCKETGWDERPPVCEVVKCVNPPSIPDGEFEPEEDWYNYGQGVTYSCKKGLDLFGPSLLKCSGDGTFQPAPPQCLHVSCESPKILNAVRIEGKSPPYKYSEFVRYQCDTGYKMEGSDFLICKEFGWDPPPPQCTIVTCSGPPHIDNGQFNPQMEVYTYGNGVRYRCNEGFNLKGPAEALCTEHGIFHPPPPRCQEIVCDPQTIQNAVVVGNSAFYRYNESVQIRCNKGYKRVGSDHLTCGVKGWRPRVSPCVVVTCSPPLINNGQFNPQKKSYTYGNRVRYRCDKGFTLKGPANSTCTEHGIFHPPPPQCQVGAWCGFAEIVCDPQTIQNAVVVGNSDFYRYNESVQIRCNKGYKRVGSDHVTCGVKGWRPRVSPCVVVTCSPPLINNGQFNPQKKSYTYGNGVRYRCDKGFTLKGPANSTCTERGIFHPPPPQCQEKSCGPLSEFSHGRYFIPDGILFGATVTAECDTGYVLVGDSTRRCQADGWDGRDPVCEAVKCKPPPSIKNGGVDATEEIYKYGQTVTYSCDKDYTLVGEATVACSDNGNFPPPPQCLYINPFPDLVSVSSSVPPAEQTSPKSMDG